MNFNNLPDDIKFMIFNINRDKQIEIEKDKFSMVLDDIKNINEYAISATDYNENNPIYHQLLAINEIKCQGGYGEAMFSGYLTYPNWFIE
tara:strand:+ start:80 stop:349 length:270 start_codon:yes stop_codon:yes gene_type:complete